MEYPAIHEYTEDNRLIKLTIEELLKLPMENWKHNRPPDEVRVAEIESFIKKRANEILQPFYIHYNPKTDIYEILDGIHRYSAIKEVSEKNMENISDKIVFIHLFIDLSYGTLIDIFQNLNKTVPVPELYIGQTQDNTNKKEIIEEISTEWKKMYKEHFSGSKTSCQIPNIIRDSFIDILSELYTSYKIRSKSKLLELLERANTNIKDYVLAGVSFRTIPIKFSDNQLQKCSKSGCYLFLYRDISKIKYFIEKEVTGVFV
jgi:hypothetical protein